MNGKSWLVGALAGSVLATSMLVAPVAAQLVPSFVPPGVGAPGAMPNKEFFDLAGKIAHSKYWIGVACAPVSDALRAQLDLEHGLVISEVIDDGPAAKAELKVHDILVSVGDEPLDSVGKLVDVIEEQGEKPLKFKVLRGGKERTVEITPASRPKAYGGMLTPPHEVEKHIRKYTEELRKGPQDMDMMIIRPGVVVPPGTVKPLELPEDVAVSIRKKGDAPAEIEVRRGDKTWKVTEDELDKLPPDVRSWVEGVRGRQIGVTIKPEGGEARELRLRTFAAPPVLTAPRGEDPFAALTKKIDELFSEMRDSKHTRKLQEQIDELRREMKELRRDFDQRDK